MEDMSTPVTAGSIPVITSHSVMEIRWLSLLQKQDVHTQLFESASKDRRRRMACPCRHALTHKWSQKIVQMSMVIGTTYLSWHHSHRDREMPFECT